MMDIRAVASSGSTNDDLAAMAIRGAAVEGTWLRADLQTAGRGRQGRVWQSPVGNLYASTLVRLRPGDAPAPTLAFVAAVALDELISAMVGPDRAQLKWPNDLLVACGDDGLAKLSGILLERAGDAVVIGFGVNLAHAPKGLGRPVTSLSKCGIDPPAPADFVADLASAFARWLARWRGEGLEPVRQRWLARAHPIGTALSARDPDGSEIAGLFDGLDAGGALRLRTADGSRIVIHAGDVFLADGAAV